MSRIQQFKDKCVSFWQKTHTGKLRLVTNGIFKNNPVFIQMLGMCPILAVSTLLVNGIGMGLSATFVLIASNVTISLLRKFIPDKVRIASFVVISSGLVTVLDLLMKAFMPDLSDKLGIFIPLITVNCIILARVESFAFKNTVGASALDGLGIGLGFTGALIILSSVREILGYGTIGGLKLFGSSFEPVQIITLAPGGFIMLGLLIALIQFISNRRRKKEGTAG